MATTTHHKPNIKNDLETSTESGPATPSASSKRRVKEVRADILRKEKLAELAKQDPNHKPPPEIDRDQLIVVEFKPLPPFEAQAEGEYHQASIEGVEGVMVYPAGREARELAQKEEVPFLHFLSPPKIQEQKSSTKPTLIPLFCDHHTKNIFGVEIKTEKGSHWYGGGEQARTLCLNNTHFITWNTDVPSYNQTYESLYQTHPFLMLLKPDGSVHGLIVNSSYPLYFEMQETGVKIMSRHTTPLPFSIFLFDAASPQQLTQKLAKMTGYIEMPPKWTLGYQQCRWSYYPDTVAMKIAETFREKKIPCDVIWFDIHYMDGHRIFTFDDETFPDPKRLNEDLKKIGFHNVWMIDPGVKVEEGYPIYDQSREKGLLVMHKKGPILDDEERDWAGTVWPGECVFPDFTMEEARKWWAGLYKDFMAYGIDGVWNDMNEPACFNESKTMSPDAWHRGFGEGSHAKFHNAYGMLMARATKEGILQANPDKRPFVLSRSNYLGGQRYAAAWTGDNCSNWNHITLSIPMCLNMGISGQPFVGPDLGGFFEESNPKLFARWMGFGCMLPFARGHTTEETGPHEPWAFGEECEHVSRVAIERRYRLLPYFYTYYYVAATEGLPIARPVFYLDPKDPKLRTENDSFMLGDDVLVCADLLKERKDKFSPYFPTSHTWYDLKLDDVQHSDLPILKIRAGGIVTLQEVEQYVGEKPQTLQLVIALDSNGEACGQYYNDSGNGFEYQKGEYLHLKFKAHLKGKELSVAVSSQGSYPMPNCQVPLQILHGEKVYNKTLKQLTTDTTTFQLDD